jgi:hypothetical protein
VVEHRGVFSVRAEQDDLGVLLDPDAVPGRPMEDVSRGCRS